jgi:hypothetical protein
MGAGLDIDIRLEIIKLIFSLSQSTTVHVKELASGGGLDSICESCFERILIG